MTSKFFVLVYENQKRLLGALSGSNQKSPEIKSAIILVRNKPRSKQESYAYVNGVQKNSTFKYDSEMKRIALAIEDCSAYEFDFIDFKKTTIYENEFSLPANIQRLRQGQSELNIENPIPVPELPSVNLPTTIPSVNDPASSPSSLVVDTGSEDESSHTSINQTRNQYPLVERDAECIKRSKKFFEQLGDLKNII